MIGLNKHNLRVSHDWVQNDTRVIGAHQVIHFKETFQKLATPFEVTPFMC